MERELSGVAAHGKIAGIREPGEVRIMGDKEAEGALPDGWGSSREELCQVLQIVGRCSVDVNGAVGSPGKLEGLAESGLGMAPTCALLDVGAEAQLKVDG